MTKGYWKRAQTSIKKLIVQVKKWKFDRFKRFLLTEIAFFFGDVRYWFHVSAQKLSAVMCNSNESAVLCLEEEREFSLCMRLWTHDHSVAFRICLRKRNPSFLVSFKTLRYSRNKENRKGKQVIKNDTFYVSLPSPVISTFCAALCFLSGCLNTNFFSFTGLSPPETFILLKLVSPRT